MSAIQKEETLKGFDVKIWKFQELSHHHSVIFKTEKEATAYSMGLFAATKGATGRECKEIKSKE